MNYIYDLCLCFSKEYMDSFEWKKEDSFQIMERIPIMKISDIQMREIFSHTIQLSREDLSTIRDKTLPSSFKNSYYLLVTDLNRVIALEFDEDGYLFQRSSLLLDEEDIVMEEAGEYPLEELNYQVVDSCGSFSFLTRKEKEIQKYLIHKLDSLYQLNCQDEVNYLYHELFQEELSFGEKYQMLRNSILNDFNFEHQKLYDILLLTQ